MSSAATSPSGSPDARSMSPRVSRVLLPALVLVSGFCGISYEILYTKLLGNLLGNQFTISASVLLTFLLGIGFGTLYAHRFVRWLWAVEASIGLSVMEIAHVHGIDIEGACEGCMACSTCHVIVDPNHVGRLQPAAEDEEDMLDLAFGLTETSRLGCQIEMSEALDGLVVRLPASTRNMLLA